MNALPDEGRRRPELMQVIQQVVATDGHCLLQKVSGCMQPGTSCRALAVVGEPAERPDPVRRRKQGMAAAWVGLCLHPEQDPAGRLREALRRRAAGLKEGGAR